MSDEAIRWARSLRFKYSELKMTQADHNVLGYLAENHKPGRKDVLASQKEIAGATGGSVRNVKRVLPRLRDSGVLSVWKKGRADHWASEFEFGLGFVPKPQSEPGTSCHRTGDIPSSNWGHPVITNASLLLENQNQNRNQNRGNAPNFSQADFDERDLRLLEKAEQELAKSMLGVWVVEQHPPPEGALSTRMVFERACSRAGIPFARGCHLENGSEGVSATTIRCSIEVAARPLN